MSVAATLWAESESGVFAVVHETLKVPTKPVWEAIDFVEGRGDGMGVHPGSDLLGLTLRLADCAQDVIIIGLWEAGYDPLWPQCWKHPNTHPLRAVARAVPGNPEAGEVAQWACPLGTTSIVIGELGS